MRLDIDVKASNMLVEERLFVKVRQIDREIKLQLVKRGVLKTEVVAMYKLRIKQDLIDRKFPKREWSAP